MCRADKINSGIFVPDPSPLGPGATPLVQRYFTLSAAIMASAPFKNVLVEIPGDFVWLNSGTQMAAPFYMHLVRDDPFGIDLLAAGLAGGRGIAFRRRFERFYLSTPAAQGAGNTIVRFVGVSNGLVDSISLV
jgi:hypothetical protein